MDIKDILRKSERPELYEKGSAVMWTDPCISKQLIEVQLNPDIVLASRRKTTIKSTAEWILEKVPQKK